MIMAMEKLEGRQVYIRVRGRGSSAEDTAMAKTWELDKIHCWKNMAAWRGEQKGRKQSGSGSWHEDSGA